MKSKELDGWQNFEETKKLLGIWQKQNLRREADVDSMKVSARLVGYN